MSEIELKNSLVIEIGTEPKLVPGIIILKDALKNGPVRLSLDNMKRVVQNIQDGNTHPIGDRIAVPLTDAKETRRALYEQLRKEFKDE